MFNLNNPFKHKAASPQEAKVQELAQMAKDLNLDVPPEGIKFTMDTLEREGRQDDPEARAEALKMRAAAVQAERSNQQLEVQPDLTVERRPN